MAGTAHQQRGGASAPRFTLATALGSTSAFVSIFTVGASLARGTPTGEGALTGMAAAAVVLFLALVIRALGDGAGFWTMTLRGGVVLVAVLVAVGTVAATASWLASPSVRAADGNNLGTTIVGGAAYGLFLAPHAFACSAIRSGVIIARRRTGEARAQDGGHER